MLTYSVVRHKQLESFSHSALHIKPNTFRMDRDNTTDAIQQEQAAVRKPSFGIEECEDATWEDVCKACCHHSFREWIAVAVGIYAIAFFLYFFLFGLELLGTSAKVMTGCTAGALFGEDTNPVAGIMIGILATVLMQSSSTTTSIIVTLVPDVVSVEQGIFMVMGANIGTSVTNTIVAMGQVGDSEQLERAFAGATVHDMFNFMTVAILLPLEASTKYLFHLTKALVKNYDRDKGEKWEGPVKKAVSPLADRLIIANKKILEGIAAGEGSCDDGDGYYPIICEGGIETYKACTRVGLITCDKDTNMCPAFFQHDASAHDDKTSGGVVFVLAIVILFACLAGLVAVLQQLLMGLSTRIVYKTTNINAYVAMALGAGITVLVQSSSITTSTLTPLVGIGAIRLEQMYAMTLGANPGTTLTGIMAALVSGKQKSMQVALAHLFFNVSGILIFFPLPSLPKLPLVSAAKLGKAARIWRGFPIVYIAVMFFGMPILLLGLSSMFEQDSIGLTVLASLLTVLLVLALLYTIFWFRLNNGQQYCIACFERREKRRTVMEDLPEDMEFLMTKVMALIDHTGLPDESDDSEEGELNIAVIGGSVTNDVE